MPEKIDSHVICFIFLNMAPNLDLKKEISLAVLFSLKFMYMPKQKHGLFLNALGEEEKP